MDGELMKAGGGNLLFIQMFLCVLMQLLCIRSKRRDYPTKVMTKLHMFMESANLLIEQLCRTNSGTPN